MEETLTSETKHVDTHKRRFGFFRNNQREPIMVKASTDLSSSLNPDAEFVMKPKEKRGRNLRLKSFFHLFSKSSSSVAQLDTQKSKDYSTVSQLDTTLQELSGIEEMLPSFTQLNRYSPAFDTKSEGLALTIILPPKVRGNDFKVSIELKTFANTVANNIYPGTPGLNISERSNNSSIYVGIIKIPSITTISEVSKMPLYLMNGDSSEGMKKIETIIKPEHNILPELYDPNMRVEEIKLRLNFEYLKNGIHWNSWDRLKYGFVSNENLVQSMKNIKPEELVSQITEEANVTYPESAKNIVIEILSQVVSKITLKSSSAEDLIQDFHKELSAQKNLLLESTSSILPHHDLLLTKISESDQEYISDAVSDTWFSGSKSNAESLSEYNADIESMYHLKVPSNTPDVLIPQYVIVPKSEWKRINVFPWKSSSKKALRDEVRADIDRTLELLETAKNKLLSYLEQNAYPDFYTDSGREMALADLLPIDKMLTSAKAMINNGNKLIGRKQQFFRPSQTRIAEEISAFSSKRAIVDRPVIIDVEEIDCFVIENSPMFMQAIGDNSPQNDSFNDNDTCREENEDATEEDLEDYNQNSNVQSSTNEFNTKSISERTDEKETINNRQKEVKHETESSPFHSLYKDRLKQMEIEGGKVTEASDEKSVIDIDVPYTITTQNDRAFAKRYTRTPENIPSYVVNHDIDILLKELREGSDLLRNSIDIRLEKEQMKKEIQEILDIIFEKIDDYSEPEDSCNVLKNVEIPTVSSVYFCLIEEPNISLEARKPLKNQNRMRSIAKKIKWNIPRIISYNIHNFIFYRQILSLIPSMKYSRYISNGNVDDFVKATAKLILQICNEARLTSKRALLLLTSSECMKLISNMSDENKQHPLIRKSAKLLPFEKKAGSEKFPPNETHSSDEECQKVIHPTGETKKTIKQPHNAQEMIYISTFYKFILMQYLSDRSTADSQRYKFGLKGGENLHAMDKIRLKKPKKPPNGISSGMKMNPFRMLPTGQQNNTTNVDLDSEETVDTIQPNSRSFPILKQDSLENVVTSDLEVMGESLLLVHEGNVDENGSEIELRMDIREKHPQPVADIPRTFETSSIGHTYMQNLKVLQARFGEEKARYKYFSESARSIIANASNGSSIVDTAAWRDEKTTTNSVSSATHEGSTDSSGGRNSTSDYFADDERDLIPRFRLEYVSQQELNDPQDVAKIEANVRQNDELNQKHVKLSSPSEFTLSESDIRFLLLAERVSSPLNSSSASLISDANDMKAQK